RGLAVAVVNVKLPVLQFDTECDEVRAALRDFPSLRVEVLAHVEAGASLGVRGVG
ncbi:unnamed protein product, partial [Cercospora beticola]